MDTDPPGTPVGGPWRAHALDGALLFFDPSTGTSVRVDAPFTRGLRRRAPRVVLFALSHACNLHCAICARERTSARWSNERAFELLSALADQGTLEVAFGGGEPLVHRGFLELVARLSRETPLAVHLTTNGTRVTPSMARALAPYVGQVRVSIYDDNPWRDAIEYLVDASVLVGANLVVDPERLPLVPALLHDLRARGVADVALLRRVDTDDARGQLDEFELSALEALLQDAPLPVRVSHCFADRMAGLPRLFSGVDQDACGAGRDFVVIDPSPGPQGVFRACSFHDVRVPFEDPADLLARWRARAAALGAPSTRVGCARPFARRPIEDGVRVYRAFASNNSGDTVLVARFQEAPVAKQLRERIEELESGERDAKWRAALEALGTDFGQPFEVSARAVGRCLLASAYDADDALGGVRVLAAAEHGLPVMSAVHIHDSPRVLLGFGGVDAEVREALGGLGARASERHGDGTFAVIAPARRSEWTDVIDAAQEIAQDQGWPLAAELLAPAHEESERLSKALSQPDRSDAGYLLIGAPWGVPVERLASEFGKDGKVAYAGSVVLVRLRRAPRRRALLRLAQRGFVAKVLADAPVYEVGFAAWSRAGRKSPVRARIDEAFQMTARNQAFRMQEQRYGGVRGTAQGDPIALLDMLRRVAVLVPATVSFSVFVREVEPLRAAVGRVRRELRVLQSER